MNGSLLDTNVVIKCIRGDMDAEDLLTRLKSPMYLSAIVVGELFYGAYKSTRTAENVALFQAFIGDHAVLPIEENISDVYGKVKLMLLRKGIHIPENDLWIAATALAYNMPLATFDEHFIYIEELQVMK